MGNKNIKYAEHSDMNASITPNDEEHSISHDLSVFNGDNLNSDLNSDASSSSMKDPRSPTVEFTRSSFYSKIASARNDRAYSQLSTVTDVGHTSESLHELSSEGGSGDSPSKSKEHFEASSESADGKHSTNLTNISASSADTPKSNGKDSDVSGASPDQFLSNEEVLEQTDHSAQLEIGPTGSSSRRKPFPRLAFGFANIDRTPKYSQIHAADD